jgi:hypothetical protein
MNIIKSILHGLSGKINSWSYVSEQERLDVDVQDYLVTSEIVYRMYQEIESLRKQNARLKKNEGASPTTK